MENTYIFRMYPNEEQCKKIHFTFGAVRFVFNHYMNIQRERYLKAQPQITYFDILKDLNNLKKSHPWLKSVDSRAFQNALKLLRDNGKKYYGTSMDVLVAHYKTKNSPVKRYMTTCNNNSIVILGDYIKLPKLKKVRITNTFSCIAGRILNAVITQKPDGNYYVYVCCTDVPEEPLDSLSNSITVSPEIIEKIPNLEILVKRYGRLKKALTRAETNSNGHGKLKLKLQALQHRIYSIQQDYYQKLSTDIIRKYGEIRVVKDGRNHEWIRFCHMLYYKSQKYQRKYIIL